MSRDRVPQMDEELMKLYRKRKMDSSDGIALENENKKQKLNSVQNNTEQNSNPEQSKNVERVVINVNRLDGEPVVYLNERLVSIAKPHQITGIRFLYEKVIGSNFENSQSNEKSCILAHGMGLGKTFQTIAFCDLFFRYTTCTRVVCIAPVSIILNWKKEFERFLPAHGKSPRIFNVYLARDKAKNCTAIVDWSKRGGVLLIGYEMFRQEMNSHDEKRNMALHLQKTELIIADEGHRLKNCKSDVVTSVSKLTSSRKIILTGYPLQNNLFEYWCMINIVRPNFLGTMDQFDELFKLPIERGQYTDSSAEEKKMMNYRSFALHSLLMDIVHREEEILNQLLPPKHDFVLFLQMTSLQESLRDAYSDYATNIFSSFSMLQKIINHPDIIHKFLTSKETETDDTENAENTDPEDNPTFKSSAVNLMTSYEPNKIESSAKMEIVFGILKECEKLGDRIVLFSQSLATLNLIERFLQSELQWTLRLNYFRLDGSTSMKSRQEMIEEFNLNPKIVIFLISTKAGALGINLTGANRVILFDVSWNPCFDMQAVSRIHRLGQTKPCFIYRLVTQSCLEETIYNHQINKQAMSARVVDRLTSLGNLSSVSKTVRYDDSSFNDIEDDRSSIESDKVLATIIANFPHLLARPPKQHVVLTTQQTLTEDEESEAMNNLSLAAKEMNFEIPRKMDIRTTTDVSPQDAETWVSEEQWQRKGMRTKVMHLKQDIKIPPSINLLKGEKIMLISTPNGHYVQLRNSKLIALKSNDIFKL